MLQAAAAEDFYAEIGAAEDVSHDVKNPASNGPDIPEGFWISTAVCLVLFVIILVLLLEKVPLT